MVKHQNVVNHDNLNWVEQSHGKIFGFRRKPLSSATGGVKLGCSLYEIPPGKKAWPYHYHTANEEAIYILEGEGTLRIGDKEIQISKGDYIACPAGGEGHQIVNSSDKELRYLCFSTMIEPDVIVYPDSNKVGVFAGSAPGGPKEKRTLHKYLKGDAEIDYWDSEK